jgi:hypothetical protein
MFIDGYEAVLYTVNQGRGSFSIITTTYFYSAGRIGEFAKSDGRDDPEEDPDDHAECELRGL